MLYHLLLRCTFLYSYSVILIINKMNNSQVIFFYVVISYLWLQRRLDSLLSSPDQSVLPAVTQLQTRSAVLASRVQQLSLRQFVDVYARLYERIASELAADPAAVASLLPRTPLSVAHLLLVEADPIPIPNPPVESESQSSVQLPPQPLEASITNQL